ncbi:hypothetical protein [Okeania sp. SIO1I7]|uniref:hypothetical protein n=1 Tax=Okeania sp. SIO1I7 TaxID=2607772 RepID=UPI0013FBC367|nr:hypothetical protein [Okeania sp. SIO1I7]NET29315.1 hypothetical protein [Okeania sp. SIO1I7]
MPLQTPVQKQNVGDLVSASAAIKPPTFKTQLKSILSTQIEILTNEPLLFSSSS